MAQPRQRRHRLLAALLVLLSLCCLARLGGAASAASAASSTDRSRKDGVAATATEKPAGQDAARGFTATTAEEVAVPARVEMEVDVEDYAPPESNGRHDLPGYSRPRGPNHP